MTIRPTPAVRAASTMAAVPPNVDGVICLVADLAVDAGAVDDRVAALEGLGQAVGADVETVACPARQDHGLVARLRQPGSQVTADEPRAAGDGDAHGCARSKTKPRTYGVRRASFVGTNPAAAAAWSHVERDWK